MDVQELMMGAATPPAPLTLGTVALFLDLDGTLAPIVARPQDVKPDARRTALIDRLAQALHGRLAVLSGRTLTDLDHILENRVRSVAGVHGLVLRGPDGELRQVAAHPGIGRATAVLRQTAEQHPGLIVEDKGVSVALHYRQAPQYATRAHEVAQRLAAETGLTLQPGSMVVELRTPGPTKGHSLRAYMAQPPFTGATPVFVGDDLTDEDGFAAAAALGGYGVLVGPPRNTAAKATLPDVDAVMAWLEAAR